LDIDVDFRKCIMQGSVTFDVQVCALRAAGVDIIYPAWVHAAHFGHACPAAPPTLCSTFLIARLPSWYCCMCIIPQRGDRSTK